MKLAAILKQKTGAPISVTTGTSISDVVHVLAEKRIGAVLVLDGKDDLVGILSERDIVRSLDKKAGATLELTAGDLMTHSPTTTSPDASVAEAMEIMSDGRFRHLPVMESGKLIGLVSIGDVVKARIDQQEHEVDSLRAYVVGAHA
jgi:CBS domain-containing protein